MNEPSKNSALLGEALLEAIRNGLVRYCYNEWAAVEEQTEDERVSEPSNPFSPFPLRAVSGRGAVGAGEEGVQFREFLKKHKA